MTFLLLPSSRLALYLAAPKKLRVLPVKADQIAQIHTQQNNIVAVSHLKTVSIFNQEILTKGTAAIQIVPSFTSTFTKKIEGVTHNHQSQVFVSDKFGDIYAISFEGQTKYLNSNLGIPTFLQYIKAGNRQFVAVGDEDTRVKIYNQKRMHEIVSFWFLTKRVPLQLLQPLPSTLVLLVKKQQQVNYQGGEQGNDNFVELYQLNIKDIESEQFSGQLLYVSQDLQNAVQCKYQTLIQSKIGNLYLLKLFTNKIKVVAFTHSNEIFKESTVYDIPIKQGQWDDIYGQVLSSQQGEQLAITYGKMTSVQNQFPQSIGEFDLQTGKNCWECSLNANEHLIVYKL